MQYDICTLATLSHPLSLSFSLCPPLFSSPLSSSSSSFFYSGTVEDTELVDGLVLEQKVSHIAGGVTRVEKAKIGLIQFCISPPKTDVGYGLSLSLSLSPLIFA